jgi:hypothetical protein
MFVPPQNAREVDIDLLLAAEKPLVPAQIRAVFDAGRLCLKSHIQLEWKAFWFVWFRVTSWIVFVFPEKSNDPRRHKN